MPGSNQLSCLTLDPPPLIGKATQVSLNLVSFTRGQNNSMPPPVKQVGLHHTDAHGVIAQLKPEALRTKLRPRALKRHHLSSKKTGHSSKTQRYCVNLKASWSFTRVLSPEKSILSSGIRRYLHFLMSLQ